METESKSEKRNTTIIMSIMAVTILVLAVVGLTYAFFSATRQNNANVKVNVITSDAASIYYDKGTNLSLNAYQPGVKESSSFKVSLNNTNPGKITGYYNIEFNILTNGFVYGTNTTDAELVYSLYKSNDNTNWTKVLDKVDCTNKTGNSVIMSNVKIEANANSSVTDYWKFELEYLNLPKNQSYNEEKSMTGTLKVVNAS